MICARMVALFVPLLFTAAAIAQVPSKTLPGKTLPGKTPPGKTLPGKTLPGKTLPYKNGADHLFVGVLPPGLGGGGKTLAGQPTKIGVPGASAGYASSHFQTIQGALEAARTSPHETVVIHVAEGPHNENLVIRHNKRVRVIGGGQYSFQTSIRGMKLGSATIRIESHCPLLGGCWGRTDFENVSIDSWPGEPLVILDNAPVDGDIIRDRAALTFLDCDLEGRGAGVVVRGDVSLDVEHCQFYRAGEVGDLQQANIVVLPDTGTDDCGFGVGGARVSVRSTTFAYAGTTASWGGVAAGAAPAIAIWRGELVLDDSIIRNWLATDPVVMLACAAATVSNGSFSRNRATVFSVDSKSSLHIQDSYFSHGESARGGTAVWTEGVTSLVNLQVDHQAACADFVTYFPSYTCSVSGSPGDDYFPGSDIVASDAAAIYHASGSLEVTNLLASDNAPFDVWSRPADQGQFVGYKALFDLGFFNTWIGHWEPSFKCENTGCHWWVP